MLFLGPKKSFCDTSNPCHNGGKCLGDSNNGTPCDCGKTTYNGEHCKQGNIVGYGNTPTTPFPPWTKLLFSLAGLNKLMFGYAQIMVCIAWWEVKLLNGCFLASNGTTGYSGL